MASATVAKCRHVPKPLLETGRPVAAAGVDRHDVRAALTELGPGHGSVPGAAPRSAGCSWPRWPSSADAWPCAEHVATRAASLTFLAKLILKV